MCKKVEISGFFLKFYFTPQAPCFGEAAPFEKFSKNVDFSFWGKQCIVPRKWNQNCENHTLCYAAQCWYKWNICAIFFEKSFCPGPSIELAAERKGGEASRERSPHYKLHWWDIMRQSLGPPEKKKSKAQANSQPLTQNEWAKKCFKCDILYKSMFLSNL